MAAKHNAFLFEAVYAFYFVMISPILFFLNPKQFCKVHALLVIRVRVLVVVLKELWWGKSFG